MRTIQAFWTRPHGAALEDYMLYTMVLSALEWRKHNGEIKLVTDTDGKDYLNKRGVLCAWNEISTALDDIPQDINPKVFWAAGKIYALKCERAPIAAIDTDFIVWERLELDNPNGIYVIHTEELDKNVYPDVEPYILFDDGFSWVQKPSNAAFYYIGNDEFIRRYTKYAEEFMKSCHEEDVLRPMLFAEQRLFSITADKIGEKLVELSTVESLMSVQNNTFTHLWGYKSRLEKSESEKKEFSERVLNRIKRDFPDFMI